MADQVMTAATEFNAVIPELWSSNFYETLLEALPFNDAVDRRYQGDIQALGDTVNITQWPQFDVAEEISEDQRVDADSITATNIQLVINKEVAKDYIMTGRAMRQAIDSEGALRDLAFHAIMKKMQSVIIAEISPSASAPDHQIAYDSGSTLALADILEAKELLDEQDVMDDGSRCLIVGSAQANDLFNITGFTSRDFIPSGSPLSSGSFPTPVLGFRVKMTTEASSTSYLFHPSFLTLAIQEQPSVRAFDLGVDGKRAMRVNMTALFGVKQLSNLRVVTIS